MAQIFAVDIRQSFGNLFYNVFALLLVELANKFWEVPIRTVLKDDY